MFSIVTDKVKDPKFNESIDLPALQDLPYIKFKTFQEDTPPRSFCKCILDALFIDEKLKDMESAPSKVILVKNILDSKTEMEPGKIYVFEVEVKCTDDKLNIFENVSDCLINWYICFMVHVELFP